jgi:hypothetical protein
VYEIFPLVFQLVSHMDFKLKGDFFTIRFLRRTLIHGYCYYKAKYFITPRSSYYYIARNDKLVPRGPCSARNVTLCVTRQGV